MVKVEFSKKNENPFYGLSRCLALFNNAGKSVPTFSELDLCWNEVGHDKQKREMFFSLLFSIGDITAREHNIFKKFSLKVDNGGNAQREAFLAIVTWMRAKHYAQFQKFLFGHLFNEYVSFDLLLANRVKTETAKKNGKVLEVYNNLVGEEQYLDDLADYCCSIIRGNNYSEKLFLAKYLTRPVTSKRKNHKKLLPVTVELNKARRSFLIRISKKMGFRVVYQKKFEIFEGFNLWKRPFIDDNESVMFSTKRIEAFDNNEFMEWLDKLPAQARYRVRRRVLGKDDKPKSKWFSSSKTNLGELFLQWEKFKEKAQKEVRVIEEKVRNKVASEEDLEKLTKVKQEAKVTTGAIEFKKLFSEIIRNQVDQLKIQPFLDKINLPYNTLVFMDDSGSMMGTFSKEGFSAFEFANFIATICLMKNPSDDARSLLGYFSQECRLFNVMDRASNSINSILNASVKQTPREPLFNPELTFVQNLEKLQSFSRAVRTANGTDISSIPLDLKEWCDGDLEKIEQLQNFPVWTIISDGNWNNLPSPEASISDFMKRCENYFGFKPYIIAIDVSEKVTDPSRFSGIDNFLFIPPNPAQIEQFLTNFKDMDNFDAYTPLLSLYRSNRYGLVREQVL